MLGRFSLGEDVFMASELVEILRFVKGAMKARNILPILGCVFLEREGNALRVTASSFCEGVEREGNALLALSKTMQTRYCLRDKWMLAVRYPQLEGVCSVLAKDEMVSLSLVQRAEVGNFRLKVQHLNGYYLLNGYLAQGYPSVSHGLVQNDFVVNSVELNAMLTSMLCMKDMSTMYLASTHKGLEAYAQYGYTLLHSGGVSTVSPHGEFLVALGRDVVSVMSKAFPNPCNLQVRYYADSRMTLESGSVCLTVRGKNLDMKVPNNLEKLKGYLGGDSYIRVPRKDFLKAFKQVSLSVDTKKVSSLVLKSAGNQFWVKSLDEGYSVTLASEHYGETDFLVKISLETLEDILKGFKGDFLELRLYAGGEESRSVLLFEEVEPNRGAMLLRGWQTVSPKDVVV